MTKLKNGKVIGPEQFENDLQEHDSIDWGAKKPERDARQAELKAIVDNINKAAVPVKDKPFNTID